MRTRHRCPEDSRQRAVRTRAARSVLKLLSAVTSALKSRLHRHLPGLMLCTLIISQSTVANAQEHPSTDPEEIQEEALLFRIGGSALAFGVDHVRAVTTQNSPARLKIAASGLGILSVDTVTLAISGARGSPELISRLGAARVAQWSSAGDRLFLLTDSQEIVIVDYAKTAIISHDSISPDSRITPLACGVSGALSLWLSSENEVVLFDRLQQRAKARPFKGTAGILSAFFSNDERTVVVSTEAGATSVLRVEDLCPLSQELGDFKGGQAVGFSEDSNSVAGVDFSGNIVVASLATGKKTHEWQGIKPSGKSVWLGGNPPSLKYCSYRGELISYDLEKRLLSERIKFSNSIAHSFWIYGDGTRCIAYDCAGKLSSFALSPANVPSHNLDAINATSAEFMEEANALTLVGDDGAVWMVALSEGGGKPVSLARASGDTRKAFGFKDVVILVDEKGHLGYLRVADGKLADGPTELGAGRFVSNPVVSGGNAYAVSLEGDLTCIPLDGRSKPTIVLPLGKHSVTLAKLQNQRLLAINADRLVVVALESGAIEESLRTDTQMSLVATSEGNEMIGYFLEGSSLTSRRIADLSRAESLLTFPMAPARVGFDAGRGLVTWSCSENGSIEWTNLSSGKCLKRAGYGSAVSRLRVSPNFGRMLVAWEDGRCAVWSLDALQLLLK